MAARYYVRGLRIWDKKTDTYSRLFSSGEVAEWFRSRSMRNGLEFKPLSEWQDDKAKSDPVNHPDHYTQGPIECIDAIEAASTTDQFVGFLRGQIIKYAWRLGRKGDAVQDARKCAWYADRLVKTLEK